MFHHPAFQVSQEARDGAAVVAEILANKDIGFLGSPYLVQIRMDSGNHAWIICRRRHHKEAFVEETYYLGKWVPGQCIALDTVYTKIDTARERMREHFTWEVKIYGNAAIVKVDEGRMALVHALTPDGSVLEYFNIFSGWQPEKGTYSLGSVNTIFSELRAASEAKLYPGLDKGEVLYGYPQVFQSESLDYRIRVNVFTAPQGATVPSYLGVRWGWWEDFAENESMTRFSSEEKAQQFIDEQVGTISHYLKFQPTETTDMPVSDSNERRIQSVSAPIKPPVSTYPDEIMQGLTVASALLGMTSEQLIRIVLKHNLIRILDTIEPQTGRIKQLLEDLKNDSGDTLHPDQQKELIDLIR